MDQNNIMSCYPAMCADDLLSWCLLSDRSENLGNHVSSYYQRLKNNIWPWLNGIRRVSISNKDGKQESVNLINKGTYRIEKISVIENLGLVIYTPDAFFVCWYQDDPEHFNLWKNELKFWSEHQNSPMTLRFVPAEKEFYFKGDHLRDINLLLHQ